MRVRRACLLSAAAGAAASTVGTATAGTAAPSDPAPSLLRIAHDPSRPRQRYAAANLRRYLAALGEPWAELTDARSLLAADATPTVVLATADDPLAARLGCTPPPGSAEAYALCGGAPASGGGAPVVAVVVGASDAGVAHGSVALLERMGARFDLGGPMLPSRPTSLAAAAPPPGSPVSASPVFDKRGLQPFHDFAEGPDWWSADAWAAVAESIAAMKGNTLAMHTYPYNATLRTGTNEPLVWVGTADAVAPNGDVTAAYPTSWANTLRVEWGTTAVNTSAFLAGAALLYDHECAGHPLQAGNPALCPWPATAADAVTLFNAVGRMFVPQFALWKAAYGVGAIVGTETPLSVPPATVSPGSTTQAVYEGIFTRLMRLYGDSLDTYWIWTPEVWEWSKVSINDPVVQLAVADLRAADAARTAVGATFNLATCGWVLGPLGNRSYLDGVLPAYWSMSSIDQEVGNTPVDPSYANVTHHAKWAIPWLEDDPGLTAVELWVNRTLEHNAQAADYRASGLLNIHWRTRSVAPQAAASHAWAWNATLTSAGFWADWAAAAFGPSAGPPAAAVFESIDSYGMPRPASWITGPGTWSPQAGNCAALAKGNYSFVDALAALRPLVLADMGTGAADASHLERFDYWLTSLRYTRAVARTSCAWNDYKSALAAIQAMPAGPARVAAATTTGYAAFAALAANATAAQWDLLSSLSSVAELGTIANTQTQSLLPNAVGPAAQATLAGLAGVPALPPGILPATTWDTGRVPLLRVPVVRGSLAAGDDLRLSALVVAHPAYTPTTVTLFTAPLGAPSPVLWMPTPMRPVPGDGVPRTVYTATVPAASLPAGGVQWYVSAVLPGNSTPFDGPDALLPSPGATLPTAPGGSILLTFPPAAPAKPQTVIIV